MNMNKAEIDEAFEKAAAESTKKMGEILDKVSALVNGIAADLKSHGETKFRREVIKLALTHAFESERIGNRLLVDVPVEKTTAYVLAIADKLAPLARAATPDTQHGHTLTDDEAAQVQAAIK